MRAQDLNARQLKFANRILDGNCTGKQAAIDAGYAPASAEVTSSKLLSNAKVAAYIAKHRENAEERAAISRERAAECMQEILEGKHKDEGKADATGRIGAYNALAKTYGWNEPEKIDLSGTLLDRIRQRSK